MGNPQIFVFIELKCGKLYQKTFTTLAMAKGTVAATTEKSQGNKERVKWCCIWDANKVYYEYIDDSYLAILEVLHDLDLYSNKKITEAIPSKELTEMAANNKPLFDKYLDYLAETHKKRPFF